MLLQGKGRIKIKWRDSNPVNFVNVEEVVNATVKEDELDLEQQVLLKNLKEIITKISQSMRHEELSKNLWYLTQHMTINESIEQCMFFLEHLHNYSDPAIINPNHREMIQDIFATMNLTEQMEKLKKEYLNFTKRIEVIKRIVTKTYEDINEAKAKEEPKEGTTKKMHIPKDNRVEDVKRFRKNIEGKNLTPQAQKKFEEEVNRYLATHPQHSESTIIRTYLDYLSSLPWGITTEDRIDIKKAKEILDEGHYGMDDIKARILEFLAVGKLRGAVHGKILCFFGPPGVGKTSIGRYIAKYLFSLMDRAINRKYFRISVGGDRSTSILKGFRRTYIGAIPGKIIQGLRDVKVSNPLILIDEVDKLTERSIHGDPSSVLLEILDPEQNNTFVDDYIDLPVDLSKVLFICTANTLSTIPKPLLDRMELIEVSGYTHAEKKHILDKYLFPQEMEKSGVTERQKEFKVTEDAKKEMIENYCRTPGVRELQRSLRRIMEKVAFKLVKGETNLEINNKNLEDYIGNPPFYPDRIYPQTPPVLLL